MKKITLLIAFIAISSICQSQNLNKDESKSVSTINYDSKKADNTNSSESTELSYLAGNKQTNKAIKKKGAVSIFPNPASDFLNITTMNKIEKVEIYNLLGQKVMTGHSNTINIKNLSKGIYFSNVQLENNTDFTIKFIKR